MGDKRAYYTDIHIYVLKVVNFLPKHTEMLAEVNRDLKHPFCDLFNYTH